MIAPSLHPGAGPRRLRAAPPLGIRPDGALDRAADCRVSLADSGLLGRPPRYAMLAWDGLVLLAALLDGLRLPRASELTASRSWTNAPALDSETEIELTIENQSRVIVECRLVDDLPPALVAEPATHRAAPLSRACPPRSATAWNRRSAATAETGWLYVRYRSPLGLAERWAKAPLTQTVRVYPALRTGEEQQIFLARSRQIDLQLRQARQRGLGRDFESLREYREGDDLRDICWTATARRGSPITRQYQTERSQPVWIVLDCGRLMRSRVAAVAPGKSALPVAETRARVHSKLDYACTTAVSLAQLALYSGDRVGLLAYGQGIQQRLLPGRGAAHLRQLIESLAQVRAEAERSGPSARHGDAQPAAAAPVADSLDHGSGRIRHAPRGDRWRCATASPARAAVCGHGPAGGGPDRASPAEKCGADVSRHRRAGDGGAPRIAAGAAARARRTDARSEPGGADVLRFESIPDREGTGDGIDPESFSKPTAR